MTQPPAAVSTRPNAEAAARETEPPLSRALEFHFRILTEREFFIFLLVEKNYCANLFFFF